MGTTMEALQILEQATTTTTMATTVATTTARGMEALVLSPTPTAS